MKTATVNLTYNNVYRCEDKTCEAFSKKLLDVVITGDLASGKTYSVGPVCPTDANVDHAVTAGLERVAHNEGFEGKSVRVQVVGPVGSRSFTWEPRK